MNPIKKRIITDACVSASTVIPVGMGFTMMVGTWAGLLGLGLGFGGFLFVLAGMGIGLTNLTTNYEKYAEQAAKDQREEARRLRNEKLDELDKRLVRDRDPRDQTALRSLREMYDDLLHDFYAGDLPKAVSEGMMKQVQDIFDASIRSLEHAADLWETACTLKGRAKDEMLVERDRVVTKVASGVEDFSTAVAAIRGLGLKNKDEDLDRLNGDLARNLRVAYRVEEELHNIDTSSRSRSYE